MDTRRKIQDVTAVVQAAREYRAQGGRVLAITGHFCLLDAGTVRELTAARRNAASAMLVAVLLETALSPLAPQARAEMAAALGVVDYVLIAGSGMPAGRLLAVLEPDAVVRCEAAHEERMRQFIHHVHQRQRSGTR